MAKPNTRAIRRKNPYYKDGSYYPNKSAYKKAIAEKKEKK
jgi:hypothetical protein